MSEDFVAVWNRLHQRRSLIPREEREVMLELTVPLTADCAEFRIGWSLKALRPSKWLAISTGLAVWSRQDLPKAGEHLGYLLEAADSFVSGRIERTED